MIFSSYIFVLGFLPITIYLYYVTGNKFGGRPAVSILVIASIVYYGWWNPAFTWIILISILFNYSLGTILSKDTASGQARKMVLIVGVFANLGGLGYFKYANFLTDAVNGTFGSDFTLERITLPLAISFFTFQQIAYIVDSYRGLVRESNFLSYCLFVTFFPQLIAGPIVHHKEMMPQFATSVSRRVTARNLSIGMTMFSIGLFKKLLIADNLSGFADNVFELAANNDVTVLEAWLGALAYTGQIYFDFSAYSDMAIGVARIFGIRLPVNFLSPYKAASIIDFWRRWHMTLSRFLRDYVYFSLGGNRKGPSRRLVNIMLTMLIGGLWHGAAWTFVFWGGLHGAFLIINHGWRDLRSRLGLTRPSSFGLLTGQAMTFVCVTIAWVFFRAPTFDVAFGIVKGMFGFNGLVLPGSFESRLGGMATALADLGIAFGNPGAFTTMGALYVGSALMIAWFLPNTYEIMRRYQPILQSAEILKEISFAARFIRWTPTLVWAVYVAALLLISLVYMGGHQKFLYFDF